MTSTKRHLLYGFLTILVLFGAAFGWVVANEKNTDSVRTLSSGEMGEDFSIAVRTLREFHPGLFRYSTPDVFEKRIKDFESKLSKPMLADRFLGLLAQFLSEIKCYHTHLNPFNQTEKTKAMLTGRRTYFPFYFELINRKMIVSANASPAALSVGSEIKKINGVPVAEIIDALLTVTKADGNGTPGHRLESIEVNRTNGTTYALFDIYYPIFFKIRKAEYKIEAKDFKTGRNLTFRVPALTEKDRLDEMEKRYGREAGYDDGWSFNVGGDGTAVLRMAHFITWKLSFKYKDFLAKAFAEMRLKGARNLIIDIRGNGGGDSTVALETFRYLATQELQCKTGFTTFIRRAKGDSELLGYAKTYEPAIKKALENGLPEAAYKKSANTDLLEYLPDSADCAPIEPHENRFAGSVYLITGAANSSAAFSFAYDAQKQGLAKIVGRGTGGNKRGFNGGSYLFINLPNSKFEFDIPLFGYYSDQKQEDEGVIPDVVVEQTVEDIGNGFDRELDTVKKLIRVD